MPRDRHILTSEQVERIRRRYPPGTRIQLASMDTYVHCLDERKRNEIAKMDDLYDIPVDLPIDGTTYPVLCRPTDDGCTLYVPDFPNLEVNAPTMQEALMKVKERILGRMRLYIHPPVPSKQEKIVVPDTCFLMLVNVA